MTVSTPDVVVDGGDLACGELLLALAVQLRGRSPGSHVRLIATDPAAALDLPAWTHLTGHTYLGRAVGADGRPYYDLVSAASPRETRADRPWHPVAPSVGTVPIARGARP